MVVWKVFICVPANVVVKSVTAKVLEGQTVRAAQTSQALRLSAMSIL